MAFLIISNDKNAHDKTATFTREHNPYLLKSFEDHEYISHQAVVVPHL